MSSSVRKFKQITYLHRFINFLCECFPCLLQTVKQSTLENAYMNNLNISHVILFQLENFR